MLKRWLHNWRRIGLLHVYEQKMKDHESRIQELEKELDLGSEPSEFGNKLQRRRHLELLKDTPLSEEEAEQWQAGL